MASDGDTITYTFSNQKETEDISNIDEVIIERMDGGDGTPNDGGTAAGGSGGRIEFATADVSEYDTLEIWVGGIDNSGFGVVTFGRASGGSDGTTLAGAGSGSTELWAGGESVFIAAADGGGGGGNIRTDSQGITRAAGGGAGARGGIGGEGSNAEEVDDGPNADGSGFGGDGGDADFDNSIEQDGGDGGQELGIASGGATTTGGSADGVGEIKLTFIAAPTAPSNLNLSLQ